MNKPIQPMASSSAPHQISKPAITIWMATCCTGRPMTNHDQNMLGKSSRV